MSMKKALSPGSTRSSGKFFIKQPGLIPGGEIPMPSGTPINLQRKTPDYLGVLAERRRSASFAFCSSVSSTFRFG